PDALPSYAAGSATRCEQREQRSCFRSAQEASVGSSSSGSLLVRNAYRTKAQGRQPAKISQGRKRVGRRAMLDAVIVDLQGERREAWAAAGRWTKGQGTRGAHGHMPR